VSRLDVYLAANGLAASRQKALWLIENGYVKVDGKTTMKPSTIIGEEMAVEVAPVKTYVGRGGLKLEGFFEEFELDVKGFLCLDAGASTGGFTEVLLDRGAAKVVAVDVGTMQLSNELREKSEVESFENMDIRNFKYPQKFDLVVADLAFISTKELLNTLGYFSKKYVLTLFKPQFEVGKNIKRNKKGVVTDEAAIQKVIFDFELEIERLGFSLLFKTPCKFAGKEGNQEYFYLCEVKA
jgi:23S rRNA (cytidine1920-2'-O)/16S rRNA (cytidine1409-2'-O)-methyltransferase